MMRIAPSFSFSLAPLKRVTTSCYPLWISSLVALVIQQLSILVLSKYAALEDIAIYSIAAKIAVLMSFILFAFNTILAPKFAALYATDQHIALKKLATQANKVLLLIAISISVFMYILSNELMALFGEEYIRGTLWLKILIIGQLINVGTGSVVNLLIMTGHEKLHRNISLLVAFVTMILVTLLIPLYGATGAAIVTAVAMSLQNLLSYYFAHKTILNKNDAIL
jgi:O-antigen/teichoic acid export membrane protein